MSSTNVGSIHYDLSLNTDKFEKQANTISAKTKRIGDDFKSIGAQMTGFVTLPIVAGFGLAIKRASDLNETINKVDVAFKDNAERVKQWSQTTTQNFGLAASTALESAALFGDMGTAMGLNTKQAADMSMSLTGLAGDLASFKNISIDEATTALSGVFTGETESLKRLGIVMLDTQLEQYALTKGTEKSWKEMTQAEKVALRYSYVMDATKNAQGDFARTSSGTANQIRILRERFKALTEQIGMKLLPIANRFLSFGQRLIDRFTSLPDLFQKVILVVLGLAAAIGPLLLVLGMMASGLAVIASPIGLIIAGAVALAAAIGFLQAKFGILNPVINLFRQGFALLMPVLKQIWAVLSVELLPQLKRLWDLVSPVLLPALKALGILIGGTLVVALLALVYSIKITVQALGYVIAVVSNLIQWFRNLVSWNIQIYSTIARWIGLTAVVSHVFNSIRNIIGGSIQGALNSVWGFWGRFVDAGWGLIRAFATGIRGAFGEAKQAVQNGLTDIRKMLPFSDAKVGPLSDLTLSGQRFSETFAQGVMRGGGNLRKAVADTLGGGMNQARVANQSVNTTINGNISIGSQVDSQNFFERLTRNQELASKNIATKAGAIG